MSIYTPHAPIAAPGWKAKQSAAKAKRERNTVDPGVLAARLRILEEREARAEAQAEAEQQARTRPQETFRMAIASVPDDALAELARYIGQLNPRDMADIAGETLNERNRARIAAAHRETTEAPAVSKVSSAGRPR